MVFGPGGGGGELLEAKKCDLHSIPRPQFFGLQYPGLWRLVVLLVVISILEESIANTLEVELETTRFSETSVVVYKSDITIRKKKLGKNLSDIMVFQGLSLPS
jgi:hypothetical protein